MGHDYYKTATTHEAEHALLSLMLGESLRDHYCPWEGPGFDVEVEAGVWDFLKVRLVDGEVVVAGLRGEHRFLLNQVG